MKCECELAGYCKRHKVKKTNRMLELCQAGGRYWEAWEANRWAWQITEYNGEPSWAIKLVRNPDCQCELAGYCERHKVRKANRLIELCKQRGAYWDAWERGEGPGQGEPSMQREPKQEPPYNHWCKLHYYPVVHSQNWDERKANRFYCGWVRAIPNSRGCGCRAKWIELDFQFDFSTPQSFFESSVCGHNLVNEKLGKPTMTLAEAKSVWGLEMSNSPISKKSAKDF